MEEEKVMTREEVKQEMLDYVENKYHEEFEVKSIDYKGWHNGYMETMWAYPKGENPNYNFLVERKGKNQITDDYVEFTMNKIYKEKATKIIEKYFPDSVSQIGIYAAVPVPDSFRPDMEFEEFQKFAHKKAPLGCTIYLVAEQEEELDQEKIDLLQSELRELNHVGDITFLGYSAEGFDKYILHDPFNSLEENTGFSNNGQKIRIYVKWGEIDFDYEYEEGK